MSKILIVDDEQYIRELICKYASKESFTTYQAENGQEAIDMVKNNDFDLVVMDIMMPVLDGFSSVKEIRKFSNVPVIMLSARSEEYDKLYGFDLGIDDYVTKPFSPKELMMRIKAVLSRFERALKKEEQVKQTFTYQDLLVDMSAYTVYIKDEKIDLTLKEYELLVALIKNVNNAVTREDLLKDIWGINDSLDRTLDTHVKSLRKKLGKYSENIITIRRVGYRFEIR